MRPSDAAFADPRLAVLYDALDGDRDDLDLYLGIAEEVGARTVVDIGCGTGCLALLLAARGLDVVGGHPAVASLQVARAKPGAERVRWVEGDATALADLDLAADLAVMTGNVAQVFVSDDDWHATLAAVAGCLRPGGWFVFETRRFQARAWEDWDVASTDVALPDGRTAQVARTVTLVDLPLIGLETTTRIDSELLTSSSTLRFRDRGAVSADLRAHGFEPTEVRDALDRPGLEDVHLARRA